MEQDTGRTSKEEEHAKKISALNKNLAVYKKGIELLLTKIMVTKPSKEDIDNYDVDKEFKLIEEKKSKLSATQRHMVCRLKLFKKVALDGQD